MLWIEHAYVVVVLYSIIFNASICANWFGPIAIAKVKLAQFFSKRRNAGENNVRMITLFRYSSFRIPTRNEFFV